MVTLGGRLELSVAFEKDPPRAIDHHFRDRRVADQIGDGPQKRQDELEAHDRARSARGSGSDGAWARAAAGAGVGRDASPVARRVALVTRVSG